jgi:hypothetical protein
MKRRNLQKNRKNPNPQTHKQQQDTERHREIAMGRERMKERE